MNAHSHQSILLLTAVCVCLFAEVRVRGSTKTLVHHSNYVIYSRLVNEYVYYNIV